LIPPQTDNFKATFAARKARPGSDADVYYTDYVMPALAVPAAGRKSVSTNLYAGAKQVALIDGYEKQLGIKRFDHQAAVLSDGNHQRRGAQFRRDDPAAHAHREGAVLPARQQVL
jgi:hypothetical protein